MPTFSIIIPARNEERALPFCLESIRRASVSYTSQVEIIVVLNRCTDQTESIAHQFGVVTIKDDSRNLARIRNAGARVARGEILITIDADSQMSENTLVEIEKSLKSPCIIGGGVRIRPERTSLGIGITFFGLQVFLKMTGLFAGLYWCRRSTFEELGGFNEHLLMAEDVNFAWRLKRLGRLKNLRAINLASAFITTSCRKFDHYGDWYAFKFLFRWREIWRGIRGSHRRFPDDYFYDFKR